MNRKCTAPLIAATVAAALLFASPLPNFIALLAWVGFVQPRFPATISWDAKDAHLKCFGSIAEPRLWPSPPNAACEAMWLCANEAVLT